MADKKIIVASLQLDTGTSNQNIKEVNSNIKELKGSLADTSNQVNKTSKDVDQSSGSFSKIKGQIGALPGPLGAAQDGVGKVGTAFKALLANPIILFLTAIVAVLGLIYKAFTNTVAGGNKVEEVFAGIKAAGQALLDNLEKIGSAIVKVFKFDFSGAINDIKGVVKEAGAAYNAMAALTKQAQGLKKEQLANDLDSAVRAKQLAELRAKATDDSVPIKERIALIKQLKADAEQNAKDDIDLAKRTADNKIAQLTLQKEGALKNQEEITKIKIDQINVETENANELRNIGRQLTGAERQEESERKAIAQEREARNKEAAAAAKVRAKEREGLLKKQTKLEADLAKSHSDYLAKQILDEQAYGAQLAKEDQARADAEVARVTRNQQTLLDTKNKLAELNLLDNPDNVEAKIAKIQTGLDLENALLAENDIQRQINAKNASNAIKQIKDEESNYIKEKAEAEAEFERKKVSMIGDALGTLADIVGRQSAAGKALAIAQTTIDTIQAGFSAFTGMVKTIPGPIGIALGVAAAAGAVASGIASVKKIVAVKVPGGGGGGGSIPSLPTMPAAPVAPLSPSVRLDQAGLNNAGNAAIQPLQTYMIESQGATAQERTARLQRAARLGG